MTGVIVPLYTYPTDSSWLAMITQKAAHPSVPLAAVVNPNSGVGGVKDPVYVANIKSLQAAGIVVLGYVHTSYANRTLASVENEIARWQTWYGVDGIMFDEESTNVGVASYYQTLQSFTQGKGFALTIGNPGAEESAPLEGIFTSLCEWETAGMPPFVSPGDSYIATALPSLPMALFAGTAAWIYVTDESDPPSYSRLPSYFSMLVGVLDTGAPPPPPPPPTVTTLTPGLYRVN
jgi:Spherulation-specific family 4